MGLWSTVGPVLGIISPILAGLIVAAWSWRASFVPGMIIAIVSILAIHFMTSASTRQTQYKFLKSFDWIGVILLSITLISLLFYFSSRPITGRPALQDWRLFLCTILFLALFIRHENRKTNPFINLQIFRNRALVTGSVSAGLRMLTLGGVLGFLMPLYLADVVQLDPTRSGFYLMVNPVAMTLFVRYGSRLSDRFGSRMIGRMGFGIITAVMLAFSQLPGNAPHWLIVLLLFIFGTGTGLMLAVLHQASLNEVPTADLGASSGIYSMIRFLGSACGAAFGGVLLQFYLDQSGITQVAAYQHVFLWFAGFAILGLLTASFLPQTTPPYLYGQSARVN
jgi:DHA2 family multidrug resistance protein-like MFS transporter